MKAKLLFNDKEFEVEITEEQVQALIQAKKKTGYERVAENCEYLYIDSGSKLCQAHDWSYRIDDLLYDRANYYSDRTIAENNARADKLYRQLRRFAVEHRENKIDWNKQTDKCFITFDTEDSEIIIDYNDIYKGFSTIYFDTERTARLAIDTFKDELLWYFTEYKDSL